jgi:tetratricopeptide (TPR) repeat protein
LLTDNLISLRHHQALSAWRDGHRCLALADEAGALAAFQAAETFDPELWQASLDLGRLLQTRGAGEAALTILARVVAHTDVPEAHLAFASACHEAGDYGTASSHYRAASRMLGDFEPSLYFDWAQSALAMDDFGQAQTCLERFQRLRPGDVRVKQLLRSLPRMREFLAGERHTAKVQAYIEHGTVLLGCASDDGLDIRQQPTALMCQADLAVTANRFVGLAKTLSWQFDAFVCGSRSIRPWVQALSRLMELPIVTREESVPGQRLILVELNWCEAAAMRLAELQAETGQAWGMSLGVKFGASPAHFAALTSMVSVPWYRVGAISRDLPASRLYVDPGMNACVPEILSQCRRLGSEPGLEHLRWYRQHPHFAASSLIPAAACPS